MLAPANLKNSKRDLWIAHLTTFRSPGGTRGAREAAAAYAAKPRLWRQMMVEGSFSTSELDAAEIEVLRECEKFHITVQD